MDFSDSDSDDLLEIAICLSAKQPRKRSKWCKSWLLKRGELSHGQLIQELRLEPRDYANYLRMDESTYLELLSMVTPFIKRKDSLLRNAISPHERLTATLRSLATGRSYEDLKFSTLISPQALGQLIPETCEAICTVLKKDYFKVRKTNLRLLKYFYP